MSGARFGLPAWLSHPRGRRYMKSNRVTKERHKALIEDYVAQLEQADTDKVRATSGSDAVTTLSLDAVRLPPPATPGAGALGDDV